MSCEEVREELVALLDGELDPTVAAAVGEHVASCAECADEQRALRATQTLVRGELAREEPVESRFDALWAMANAPQVEKRRPRASRLAAAARRVGGSGRGRKISVALAAAAALALFVRQLPPPTAPVTAPAQPFVESESLAAPLVAGGAPTLAPELRENPDMFVDFVIVRRLEKLRLLPDLLEGDGLGDPDAGVGRT